MSGRRQRVRDSVSQLSPSTYLLDLPKVVRSFLRDSGHRTSTVGKRPLFVLRRKNRVVRVAWSPEELLKSAPNLPGATRVGRVDSVTVRIEER